MIKDHFNLRRYEGNYKNLLHEMKEYIDTLRNAATAYCDIFDPTHPSAFNAYGANGPLRSDVAAMSEKLSRLGNISSLGNLL